MIPSGFNQVPTTTTYHHLPGSVRSIRNQDNGSPTATFKDIDPRDNFVSWGSSKHLSQNILSPEGCPELSMLRRHSRDGESSLEKETLSPTGDYLHLEVRQQFDEFDAKLTVGKDGAFQDYRADSDLAKTVFEQLNQEFDAKWHIAN